MTIKNFTLTIAALAALFAPVSVSAQTTLTTTTLSNLVGAAAGVSGVSCFNVASATGIVALSFGSPNVPTGNQTELYFSDKRGGPSLQRFRKLCLRSAWIRRHGC